MSAFVSKPLDCGVHDSGWLELPAGGAITRLPIWDREARLFSRLGHGPAEEWLAERAMRLPTVAEYDALHAAALHIEPCTLPTAKMLEAAGVPKPWADASGADTPAMRAYRAAHMRTRAWCELHDSAVWRMLMAAKWKAEPVANAGKHWARGGIIYGWWRRGAKMIQPASRFHSSEPRYTDYATTFHAVSDSWSERPTTEPPPAPTTYGQRDPEGARSGPVHAWQAFLKRRGFDPGPIDGVHLGRTKAATEAYFAARSSPELASSCPPDHDTEPMMPALTASLPSIRFMQAKTYRPGRGAGAPKWLVIHTAEALERNDTAENLMRWAAGPNAPRASWHYAVDCDSITQSVQEHDQAAAAPGSNERGIHIELAGYARQSATEWLDDYSNQQLDLAARLAAHICRRWQLPAVKISPTELRAGLDGVCGHVDVSRAWRRTTHTDPGVNFPWERWLDMVRGYIEILETA